MHNLDDNSLTYELIYAIVNHGQGSQFLQKAKEFGVSGGTITFAKGTVDNKFLNFFSLYDERKELVLMGANSEVCEVAMKKLNSYFNLHKANHGIAFSTKLNSIIGSRKSQTRELIEGETNMRYRLIISIVNRGSAEDVVDAAKEKGARGATIINGRGSGTNETSKIFSIDIEPEKEVVLIITEIDKVNDIVDNIVEKLELDKPGNGIIFVQELSHVYGIFEENKE